METAALRLAAVAALLNGGIGPPWPTVAGPYVYDSEAEDIVNIAPSKNRPIVVVRTNEDRLVLQNNITQIRQVSLVIEVSILTPVTVMQGGVEVQKADWPKTSAALEASINMMEWQVWCALRGFTTWAQWFKNEAFLSKTVLMNYNSYPRFASPERGAYKLAVKNLEYVMSIPVDCLPNALKETDPTAPAILPPDFVRVVNYITQNGGGNFKAGIIALAKSIDAYGKMERPRYPVLQRIWVTLPDWEFEAVWKPEQLAHLSSRNIVAEPPSATTPQLTLS